MAAGGESGFQHPSIQTQGQATGRVPDVMCQCVSIFCHPGVQFTFAWDTAPGELHVPHAGPEAEQRAVTPRERLPQAPGLAQGQAGQQSWPSGWRPAESEGKTPKHFVAVS